MSTPQDAKICKCTSCFARHLNKARLEICAALESAPGKGTIDRHWYPLLAHEIDALFKVRLYIFQRIGLLDNPSAIRDFVSDSLEAFETLVFRLRELLAHGDCTGLDVSFVDYGRVQRSVRDMRVRLDTAQDKMQDALTEDPDPWPAPHSPLSSVAPNSPLLLAQSSPTSSFAPVVIDDGEEDGEAIHGSLTHMLEEWMRTLPSEVLAGVQEATNPPQPADTDHQPGLLVHRSDKTSETPDNLLQDPSLSAAPVANADRSLIRSQRNVSRLKLEQRKMIRELRDVLNRALLRLELPS